MGVRIRGAQKHEILRTTRENMPMRLECHNRVHALFTPNERSADARPHIQHGDTVTSGNHRRSAFQTFGGLAGALVGGIFLGVMAVNAWAVADLEAQVSASKSDLLRQQIASKNERQRHKNAIAAAEVAAADAEGMATAAEGTLAAKQGGLAKRAAALDKRKTGLARAEQAVLKREKAVASAEEAGIKRKEAVASAEEALLKREKAVASAEEALHKREKAVASAEKADLKRQQAVSVIEDTKTHR